MLANMGKRSSKGRKQGRAVKEGEAQLHCPYCGTANNEKSALSLMDQLFRSHFELCAALRLAGRQMLRSEKSGDGSLEKVREVLKRGDNIHRAVARSNGLPDVLRDPDQIELVAEALLSASDNGSGQVITEPPARKGVLKKARLKRPHSLRVIKFPTTAAD